MKIISAIVAACMLLALAGCGGGSGDSGEAARATTADDTPGPKVEIPDGDPPGQLVVEEIEEGRGKPAQAGDEVAVHYVGVRWDGTPYSNSWTYPEPPDFVLGDGELIRGFDQGLRGMRAGGRRRLLVPPRLIRTPDEKPSSLDPNATLVFIADMIEVR